MARPLFVSRARVEAYALLLSVRASARVCVMYSRQVRRIESGSSMAWTLGWAKTLRSWWKIPMTTKKKIHNNNHGDDDDSCKRRNNNNQNLNLNVGSLTQMPADLRWFTNVTYSNNNFYFFFRSFVSLSFSCERAAWKPSTHTHTHTKICSALFWQRKYLQKCLECRIFNFIAVI